MDSKVSEKDMREVYFQAFGKEYDSADRKQAPLPLEIAYIIALKKLKREGKYAGGGEITNDTYYESVNHFIYFCMNYPRNFLDAFGSLKNHLSNKFKNYYNKYGTYGVMIQFYAELDAENRRTLTDYSLKNYKGTPIDSDVSEIEYFNSVNHFIFFCFNFPSNFMDAFSSHLKVHLSSKWTNAYEKKGSVGAMIYFWSELDNENRKKLADWVRVNYTGTKLYEVGGALGDVAGMLPSPLPMSTIQPMAKGGQLEFFADGGEIPKEYEKYIKPNGSRDFHWEGNVELKESDIEIVLDWIWDELHLLYIRFLKVKNFPNIGFLQTMLHPRIGISLRVEKDFRLYSNFTMNVEDLKEYILSNKLAKGIKETIFLYRFDNEKEREYILNIDKTFAKGGGVKSDYYIFEGVDNLNGNPLYRVENSSESDNEYVGEWHTDKSDAEKELNSLSNKPTQSLGVVKVIFENPEHNYTTNVGVNVTEEEARNYFVGKMFDVGTYPKENMQKAINIEFSKSKEKYADGGETIDLFEDYENIPTNVQEVLDRYSEKFGDDLGGMNYQDMAEMHKEIEKLGYTFDSGLDNMPYGLRPIGVELSQLRGYEEYGLGGFLFGAGLGAFGYKLYLDYKKNKGKKRLKDIIKDKAKHYTKKVKSKIDSDDMFQEREERASRRKVRDSDDMFQEREERVSRRKVRDSDDVFQEREERVSRRKS